MSERSALCVLVGMRLYSSMIFTRWLIHLRQPILMALMSSAFIMSLGSGAPRRSLMVSWGWPRWMERRTSSRVMPEMSAMRMALVVLPRPGPPMSSARRHAKSVSIGTRTYEL